MKSGSKLFLWIALALILTGTSSCFQFIEEITLLNNGSGSMKLTLNMSQSKSKLASILLMDSINGHKVPNRKDIDQYMQETVTYLQKSPGISTVSKSVDLKNFILSVSFNFKNLSHLNAVIQKLSAEQKNKIPTYTYSFHAGKKSFSRTYNPGKNLKNEFGKLKSKDKEIFKTATHTSIFRFQQPIATSANKATKISASGKAAMQTSNAMQIINGTTNLSQTIQLK